MRRFLFPFLFLALNPSDETRTFESLVGLDAADSCVEDITAVPVT